jgi:hypothetical protein
MTPEASNTLLLWIFGGLAVVGAYAVVVFPIMFIIRLVNKIPLPLPEKELDELLRDINGGRTGGPYDDSQLRKRALGFGNRGLGGSCDTLEKL